MIDHLLSTIERLQMDGAVIILKWDGQRSADRCTVLITKSEVGYAWRQDSDDIEQSLRVGLADYDAIQILK